MKSNNRFLWALSAALMLAVMAVVVASAQTQNKRELLIGLPQAQEQFIAQYESEGPTTETLAALYLCELCALPVAIKGVVAKDDGTTITVWVATYAAWDMFIADMLATIAMEQGYRGQDARWPVWLRDSGVHLTGAHFMIMRDQFGK